LPREIKEGDLFEEIILIRVVYYEISSLIVIAVWVSRWNILYILPLKSIVKSAVEQIAPRIFYLGKPNLSI